MIPGEPTEVFKNISLTCYRGINDVYLFLAHTMPEWRVLLEEMMTKRRIACDTETSGFEYFRNDRICGMSFGWGNTHFYVPVRHKGSITGGQQPPQLDMDVLRPDLQKLFGRKDLIVVGSNFRFDRHMYAADDIHMKCKMHDTLIQGHLIDENAPGALKARASGWTDIMGQHHKGLVHPDANADKKLISAWREKEALARRDHVKAEVNNLTAIRASEIRFQGWKKTDIKKWVKENDLGSNPYIGKTGKESVTYDYLPIIETCKYAALDTYLTICLHDKFIPDILANKKLSTIYLEELELSDALYTSEAYGMRMNAKYLEAAGIELAEQIESTEKRALETLVSIGALDSVEGVNLSSSDTMVSILTKAGYQLTELTKSGKLKVDKKVLAKAIKQVPELSVIIELRKLQKLKSTYIDGIFEKLVNGNRLHCAFNQNVKTGRMSARQPNLMNIPSRDTSIRRSFTMPEGEYCILFSDYSQVEVRVTGHYSEDPTLLEAYATGQDIHLKSACLMFGIPLEEGIAIHKDKNHPRFAEIDTYRTIGKCYHPDTECLTRTGWKKIGDLLPTEEVLQAWPERDDINKKGKIRFEWVVPTGHVRFVPEDKKLVHVKNEGVDLRVTTDHRMLAFTSLGYPKIVMPHEFINQYSWMNAGILPDHSLTWRADHALLQLAVATQADGSFDGPAIRLGFTKQRKIARLLGLLGAFPASQWSATPKRFADKMGMDFRVKKELAEKVRNLLDTDKTLPWSWLNLSEECREVVLMEFQYWDGGQYEKWKKFNYFSTVKKNRDVAQALASLSERKTKDLLTNKATLAVKDHAHTRGGNGTCVEYEYTGDVVCCSVPSTFLLVRDGGVPVVSSNTINFGIIYGIGAPGLSEQLPRPAMHLKATPEAWKDVCQSFIDKYFEAHRHVKKFVRKYNNVVRLTGQVENYYGRVRRLPHYQAVKVTGKIKNKFMEAKAQRQGTNFVVQGTCADVFKKACVRIHKLLKGTKSILVNYVHDEVQIYLHKDDAHLVPRIRDLMEDFPFKIPLKTEFSISITNWSEKIGIDPDNVEDIIAKIESKAAA